MWIDREKEHLATLMRSRGVEWDNLGTHNEHLSVLDYKKRERSKEVTKLENDISNTNFVLKEREKLLIDAERVIDNLDETYQEKKEAVKQITEEHSGKSAELM